MRYIYLAFFSLFIFSSEFAFSGDIEAGKQDTLKTAGIVMVLEVWV